MNNSEVHYTNGSIKSYEAREMATVHKNSRHNTDRQSPESPRET